ncbi:hypothetical protein [Spiroplasma endosymbiont of Phyllotreta cruciferae]|uniref:hypothetical protein n=1 Tax=Spiroplasma endosymbiont of Phyllotreta cruciferae TaxID=2886375 RepID=UPI00209E57A3|nr:hypothetical protein [Spiroplasma endosymbiont of Phyllotreta cruciferae]
MNGRVMYNYFGEAQVLELVKKEFKKHHITYIWSYVKDTLKIINDTPYFEMELTLCKEVEKLSPVLIRKQSEDFYHKFKERFLK